MAPKTTDIIRGSEVEAEPVYKARVGRTLTVEVEVLVFTDVSEATEVVVGHHTSSRAGSGRVLC
jgi:hypothetical protein